MTPEKVAPGKQRQPQQFKILAPITFTKLYKSIIAGEKKILISHLPLEQVARLVGAFPGHQAISHQRLVFYGNAF